MEKFLWKVQHTLEELDDRILLVLLVGLSILLGYLDYLSGFEFSFSLFYLFPVMVAAWFVNQKSAVYLSFFSTIVWYTSNLFAGQTYSQPVIGYWNAAVRLGFFLITTFLLSRMKDALERQKELSRTDPITGLLNSRAFYQLAEVELQRANRYAHPYTLAYLDIDQFKQINDRFGHLTGDLILKMMAGALLKNLRQTDLIARLGGDEFAILLPEADETAARAAAHKIQRALNSEMKSHRWKVTFSMGVITYHKSTLPIDTMIKRVDALMYSVKDSGRNDIRFAIG